MKTRSSEKRWALRSNPAYRATPASAKPPSANPQSASSRSTTSPDENENANPQRNSASKSRVVSFTATSTSGMDCKSRTAASARGQSGASRSRGKRREAETAWSSEASSMSRELQMLFAAPPGMQTGDKYYGSSNRRPPRVRVSPSPLVYQDQDQDHDSFAVAYDSGQSSAAEDEDEDEDRDGDDAQDAIEHHGHNTSTHVLASGHSELQHTPKSQVGQASHVKQQGQGHKHGQEQELEQKQAREWDEEEEEEEEEEEDGYGIGMGIAMTQPVPRLQLTDNEEQGQEEEEEEEEEEELAETGQPLTGNDAGPSHDSRPGALGMFHARSSTPPLPAAANQEHPDAPTASTAAESAMVPGCSALGKRQRTGNDVAGAGEIDAIVHERVQAQLACCIDRAVSRERQRAKKKGKAERRELRQLKLENQHLRSRVETVHGVRSRFVSTDDKVRLLQVHVEALRNRYRDARKPRKVKVRRDVVLDDALTTFGKLVAPHIFRPTAVSFDGEAGIDRHGLTAEMYSLLMQDLVSPEHGLFENDHADGQLFLPCAAPKEPASCSSTSSASKASVQQQQKRELHLQRMDAFGRVLLKCLLDCEIVPRSFPPCFFESLLGRDGDGVPQDVHLALDELSVFDSQEARSLTTLLGTELDSMDAESHGLTVGMYAQNDDDTPLSDANKAEAVRARIAWLLVGSRQDSFEALRSGFLSTIPELSVHLQLFSGHELQDFMCGVARLKPEMLLSALEFSSDVPRNTRDNVNRFISTGTEARLKNFLFFTTSLLTLPPAGLRQKIRVEHDPKEGRLPSAHTCFYTLCMPEYTSYGECEKRLDFVVCNTKGFELK